MTRICSQLTNSKLPLQGQKNVEVKEEKNDEKNLYRDISTFHFRKWIFGNKKFSEIKKFSELKKFSKWRKFREINLFGKSTFSSGGKFRRFSFLEKMTFSKDRYFREIDFSKDRYFREIDFSKDRCFRGIELFKNLYFSDARSSSTAVQSSANNG